MLGVFLRSVGQKQTNWLFTDTLSQIGLGYVFLFALGHVRAVWQWVAFAVILIGYWGAFALYPLPGPDFNYSAVSGLPADQRPTGFAAHWDKNTNAAWAFDVWFRNLFPRAEPFTHESGGYATLSFIPTLATMILGLIAGGWLRSQRRPWEKVRHFAAVGVALLATGWALDAAGICPNVKRIWTPAWVLFSGGWCFLFLAGFAALLDTGRRGRWSYPLMVIGANSIVAYVAAHLFEGFILDSVKTALGTECGQVGRWVHGLLVVLWPGLWWMYRRGRVFVKI